MKLRQSRTGSTFLGCTAYPKCRNVVNVAIAGGKAEARPDEPTGEMCPRCGHELVRRHGRYGAYVSCSNYPACKYKPPKPIKDTGVRCPKDGGIIAERRGRFRPFYGCVNYPNCDFSLSVRPDPGSLPAVRQPVPALSRAQVRQRLRLRQGRMRLREAAGRSAADRRDHPGGSARGTRPGRRRRPREEAARPARREGVTRSFARAEMKAPWEKFSLPDSGPAYARAVPRNLRARCARSSARSSSGSRPFRPGRSPG